jgi:Family of unknown function (DUF6962)
VTEIRLTEPTTMLTDYALAVLVTAFAVRLRLRAGSTTSRAAWKAFASGPAGFWCLAFGVTALAALAGGTAHGFRLHLGAAAHARLWQLTVGLIILSAALTLGAAIRSVLRPSIAPGERRKTGHRWLQRGLIVTLLGVAIEQSGWGLYTHFNHNDLYHVVQMAGLYCLYRGALILEGLEDGS